MKAIILTLVFGLLVSGCISGCAQLGTYSKDVVGNLPTVQNCQKVRYTRDFAVIHLEADCDVSRGSMGF